MFGNEHEERAFNRCLKQLVWAASAVDEIDFRKKNLTGNSSSELKRGPSPPSGKAKQQRGAVVRGKNLRLRLDRRDGSEVVLNRKRSRE